MLGNDRPQSCPHLRALYGRQYRVEYEPSYFVDRSRRTVEDPWLMIIPGHYGHVFPWSQDQLAVSVDGHPKMAGQIRRLPSCTVVQDGDDGELTAAFAPANLVKVAQIVRLKRKRQISDAERRRLWDIGQDTRFEHGNNGQLSGARRTVGGSQASGTVALQ